MLTRTCMVVLSKRRISFESSRGSQTEEHNPPRGSPRKVASQGCFLEASLGVSPRVLWASAGSAEVMSLCL